ncbi:SCO family protein [Oceanobacillus bengalensis]|uniref:SCO family protein n=1 Tax=Oceanobacillus bengalensis TaxID=1435466 RepID=A0A494Z4U0_9BACI|nr:SCO family protein [Oceanobacillus bengalensis]RKQ17560.1 SCO family protein [Oceanobacillus bengalensis]
MRENWRNTVAVFISIILGSVLIYIGTDGFRAFTAEAARTYKLVQEQPEFPSVTLEDSKERVYPFSEFEGKYVLLTFIYTACTDICPKLEMNLAEVYNQIPNKYIGDDIQFLSISFDPTRDDPATLKKYSSHFDSDEETWRMARVVDTTELNELLRKFGVIVIPDGSGGFSHNSAFYLVDKNGKLLDVMDYTKIDEATDEILNVLETEG